MSLPRTMNTRELERGISIVTGLEQHSPLSHDNLLTIPDIRLRIGSHVPIPFEMDPLVPYSGDNTFGRKKQRFCDTPISSDERAKAFWCEYCAHFAAKLLSHTKSHRCQFAQRKSTILPRLTNVRTILLPQNNLIEGDSEGSQLLSLPIPITGWIECFDVMSQLAVKGLPIDFGLSDFLLNSAKVPCELNGYCALQTRTGSYLEALLLSVSY